MLRWLVIVTVLVLGACTFGPPPSTPTSTTAPPTGTASATLPAPLATAISATGTAVRLTAQSPATATSQAAPSAASPSPSPVVASPAASLTPTPIASAPAPAATATTASEATPTLAGEVTPADPATATATPTSPASAAALPGRIAFARTVRLSEDPSPAGSGCHIFIGPAGDPSQAVDLTPNTRGCHMDPARAPDGTRLAYLAETAASCFTLTVMNIDGSQPVNISDACYFQTGGPLIWSRDGQWVALLYPGDALYHTHRADGSGAGENLPSLPAETWALPELSPDGQRRAFYCPPDPNDPLQVDVCVAPVGGGEAVNLTQHPLPLSRPVLAWSPDGAWIMYTAEASLYAVRADGSQWLRVGDGVSPTWLSP